jgi:hypothetical protein
MTYLNATQVATLVAYSRRKPSEKVTVFSVIEPLICRILGTRRVYEGHLVRVAVVVKIMPC